MLKRGDAKSMNRRTPMANVSNRKISKEKFQHGDEGYFDRLLLVRSELFALVNQIDQILASALEHNMKNETTNMEIETLLKLVSGMNSSLKPWISKLSRAQTTSTPAVKFSKSLDRNSSRCTGDGSELGMIISPSPLVAWRAGGCGLVAERQLFLLTPLSKPHERSKFKARNPDMKDTNDSLQLCPLVTTSRNRGSLPEIMEESDGPKPCAVEGNNNGGKTRLKVPASLDPMFFNSSPRNSKLGPSSDRLIDEEVSDDAPYLENRLSIKPPASDNPTNRRRDEEDVEEALEWFLSPPKTCSLMDPDNGVKKPSVVEKKSSRISNPKMNRPCYGSCSDQELHVLQLCGVTNKRDSDEKLEWFLSPPKTCILMEPLEGKMASTPMLGGSVCRSRRPGENTLKKELWTKFQAVSVGRFSFADSVLKRVSKKGFMDMLEEASS